MALDNISELPSSVSTLSIATVKAANGTARSTPRSSIALASPSESIAPDLELIKDKVDLDEARRTLAEGHDVQVLRDALQRVLAIADRFAETLTAVRAQQAELEESNRVLRQTQSELETSLTLAKSNLTLERANNEMLEEALKREGSAGAGKDIGWRRWSDREASIRRSMTPSGERPGSSQARAIAMTESTSADGETGRKRSLSNSSSTGPASTSNSPTISQAPVTPPVPQESNRFFKFRFGSAVRESVSVKVSPTTLSRSPTTSGGPVVSPNPTHLTSASLPSLLVAQNKGTESPNTSRPPTPPPSKEGLNTLRIELDVLKAQLDELQKTHTGLRSSHAALETSHKSLTDAKKSLEEELESLSQALFEEANNMVAEERKKRAAYEEELEVCRAEKDALKGALKVVEAENGLLRQGKSAESLAAPVDLDSSPSVSDHEVDRKGPDGDDKPSNEEPGQSQDDAKSISSLDAVKSRPTSLVEAQPAPSRSRPGSPQQRAARIETSPQPGSPSSGTRRRIGTLNHSPAKRHSTIFL
ncbi:hypothetical protein FRB99_005474 [Tulasnella sp. 403]|nr:hypothetical protein FRB99_005474 [Tulasnella sp. 403]